MGIDSLPGDPDADDQYPDRQLDQRHAKTPDDRYGQLETRTRRECYEALRDSTGADETDGFRPWMTAQPAIERPEWRALVTAGDVDQVGLGVIDERAKEFSSAERRIAVFIAIDGPAVVSVSEGYGVHGRTPDAHIDGVPVEFKSLDAGATDRTVKAALNSAKGQARHAIIDARGSGLAEGDAQLGIRRFSGTPHGDRLDAVRIIGDDYDIDWKRAE